jgi:hypothetical protein
MLLIANLQNQYFYFCCKPFHANGSASNLFGDLHINIPLLVFEHFHFFLTDENITESIRKPIASNFNPNLKFKKHIYSIFILYSEGFITIFTKIQLQILRV